MKKLLTQLDNYILKIGVIVTILFVPLYPKLPSIHIIRTWVYIRLEDFLIAALVAIWLLQLLRRKVKLPFPVGIPLIIYWISGLLTLIYSLIFIGPHITGFFPHIAALEYFRRIEYMILFFVAFTTVKNIKDVRDYFVTLCVALVGIILYGFGQKYYTNFWAAFPDYFTKHPFCFPSFQTGNEEFAKGIPLCLPSDARITSTFGGHYDLAAYLVIVLPILLAVVVTVKKLWVKISVGILFLLSLTLLNFTASRVSFFSYIIGAIATLIFLQRKKWILPLLVISTIILLVFNGSTAKRLFETFRFVNVVTNSQGQVVGVAENTLPTTLQKKISQNDSLVVEAPPPTQNLPTGSSFITLPTAPTATSVAVVRNQLPSSEALKLKLAYGGLEISTVSGTFLVKKALVYDISFTTRFQAEWPNAWAAFMSNPPLGKGYSTITLASDNDYLRLVGESGFLGFITFMSIFLIFGIFVKASIKKIDSFAQVIALGLAGGVIGLFANASLIDVFESSKVAESLWLLLGIGVGGLSLGQRVSVAYIEKLKKILTSHIFLVSYFVILIFIVFGNSLSNFFVGDDYTWLKWAATTLPTDLTHNFINAGGFFYRPLDKTLVFFLYNFFAFQPQGYHTVTLILHLCMVFGVYLLGFRVFKEKLWAFLLALVFLIIPGSSEVIFWFSTISIILSSVFLLFGVLSFIWWRDTKRYFLYIVSLLVMALGLLSYEMAVIFPLLLVVIDVFVIKKEWKWKNLLAYLPFAFLDVLYLFIRTHAHVASFSGDYSYNLLHLIPNIVGNVLGYFSIFVSGAHTFGWYESLRTNLKPFALLIGVGIMVVLVGSYLALRKNMKKLTLKKHFTLWFGVVWVAVALLPFIGLGNITERYSYFASIGFAFIGISLLQRISEKFVDKKIGLGVVWIVVAIFFVISFTFIQGEETDWHTAGGETYITLGTLRYQYPGIEKGSHLYFVNVPIKHNNAWVFPVGLADGVWFIYRDDTMKISQVGSLTEAKTLTTTNPSNSPAKDYIFEFNKNGEINEVN